MLQLHYIPKAEYITKKETMETIGISSTVRKRLITPDRAQDWLENNSKTNRNIKSKTVKRYAEEMRQGNWIETTDTIKFDTRGCLIDGQHRLMAIVDSKVTIPLYVATNLPEETIQYLDLGKPRSVVDVAKVQGKSYNSTHFSCARSMLFFSNVNLDSLPRHSLVGFVDTYIESISFAIKTPKSEISFNMKSSKVDAIVARAYLRGANRQRLYEFKKVFSTGLPEKGEPDYAAMSLRKKITEMRNRVKIMDSEESAHRKAIIEYIQVALNHFLSYRKITKLQGTTKNLFPVPEIDNLYNRSLSAKGN